ncbi:MAG: hydrogenase maturation nickel metallochaperone HypA [Acetobacteraceae bacterium]|nr:hydrogenase maturation nickel metallochaperone HypA [Acetobacteraceae bacterium]MBV8521332.1 hydrogenase maturation nickel metallochaperone HypA [Acetobacteraceae bacterium]MBV8591664.1 hydrogenase maturation nickel metallochaperone HypA [Acetobacteraceae bacterium]
MHELSLACSIVDACAERAGEARVLRVTVEVGQLAAVLPDALRFCFDVCAQGTVLEGAELEILEIPGRAVCDECGRSIFLSSPYGVCECGGLLRIVSGTELRTKEMEIA